jgi:3-isopropylmalate dehydratase small subunit
MIRGKALVLGDDVNTDELHPSSFYSLDDTKVRQGFLRAVEGREGDAEKDLSGSIVVAGRNFGIGSSRETGARVFLLAGIQAVVAVSFARIFHRNILNLGLPALACPALADHQPRDDQEVCVDLETGRVTFGDVILTTEPLDPHWQQVLRAGGLAPYLGLEPRP